MDGLRIGYGTLPRISRGDAMRENRSGVSTRESQEERIVYKTGTGKAEDGTSPGPSRPLYTVYLASMSA